jgi:hypothetical protein
MVGSGRPEARCTGKLRQQRILETDPDGTAAVASEASHTGWKTARDEILANASHDRRSFHIDLNPVEKGNDRTWLILCNSGRQLGPRIPALPRALRWQKLVDGRQHKVVKLPSILFEAFKKIAVLPQSCRSRRYRATPKFIQR